MAIDTDALLAAIDTAKENAYGWDEQSALGTKRAKAIEYYLGLNTNPAPEGRSQIVDRSVYETIQTMLPQLVRIFAGSTDEVCRAMPIGPGDEQGAEQTTAVLKHYIVDKNQWEQICADWIHDTMLLPNGYAMAYWDESKRLIREVYEGQSEDQLALLMQDKDVNILQHSQTIDEQATAEAQEAYQRAMGQYQQQVQMLTQQAGLHGAVPGAVGGGQGAQGGLQLPPPPTPPQPVLKHDLVIERAENEGKVCIKVLAPEHCAISADTPDWTLNECPYFEYRQQKTIDDLRKMGLDVDDDISDDEDSDTTSEDMARDRFGETHTNDEKGVNRLVWARMIWVRADAEKDDTSRLYYVIVVGRTVLYSEPVGRIPVSSMTSQPLPHRHIGMSVAETVLDVQDIKQDIKRGYLDGLRLALQGRTAISSKVNTADLLDSRPGGVVRMLDDSLPAENIMPLQFPVLPFGDIIGSLEYFDQERQNRTGAMRGAAGLEANAMNKAAVGTTMAMQTANAVRIEHIARMMAPAIENLFSCVWEIISKHANKALAVKLKGNWTLVDPQAWRTKRDIRIAVGVGAGNKDAMVAQLQQVLLQQVQFGLPLGMVTRNEIHNTASEIVKLAGFADPDKFWPDPQKLPPPQTPPSPDIIKAQSTKELKQMELNADAQKFQAEQQAKMQEMQAQFQAKMAEMRAQLEVQASNDQRDFAREQQKAQMDAQLQALSEENKRLIAEQQLAVDKYKADLDAQVKLALAEKAAAPPIDIQPIQDGLQGLLEYLSAPSEIVRDPQTGRAVGMRKVKEANGRAS